MADLIQLRRDSKANWELTNPILAEGEPGIETDTRKQKVGDGISHWNNLPYMSGSAIDDEPTAGSDNVAKSSGVYKNIVQGKYRKFKLFARPIDEYEDFNVQIENALTELYIKSDTQIPNLKILFFQKAGVDGATSTQIRFGIYEPGSSVPTYYAIIHDVSERTEIVKYEYVNNGIRFYVAINWAKVTFNFIAGETKNSYLGSDVYDEYYSTIADDDIIDDIKNSLRQEISTSFLKCIKAARTSSSADINVSNNRFTNAQMIDARFVKSFEVASGYQIYIWGNNSLGETLVSLQQWETSYVKPSNLSYKYLYIIGRRTDNENITSSDDLNNIVSVTGYYGEIKKVIHPQRLIVVDANGGGDYTSLQDAIYNAGDSAENPKTILVMPGVYEMAQYNGTTRRFGSNRYLSIIGTDKNNCIIRNNVGYYTTNPYVDNACLKLAGNVYVANLTIISTDENYPSLGENNRHKAYCIHLDFTAPENTVCEINNCVLVNNHFSCIGFGLKKNYTIKIVDCEMIATMHSENGLTNYGTLYGHDGSDASDSEIQQHLFVKGCVITNTNGDYGITYINSYDKLTDLTLINNIVDVPQGNGFKKSSLASLTKKCFGNNISNMNY